VKDKTLAGRTVTGVVAGMVLVTAAATAVGFWLSYSGLHDFALRAGLRGPEAWAWPSSVDLFIAAGEAGVTISALRRESDWPAWCYLGLGLAMSVTGNVLHVHPGPLPWPPYAVAAVPPIAAMLALGALLRQVYRLASDQEHPPLDAPAIGAVPSSTLTAAETWFRQTVKVGNAASVNKIIEQFPMPRGQATKIREAVLAETNGRGAE
jgi:Protein of unknown function (DUF2637)